MESFIEEIMREENSTLVTVTESMLQDEEEIQIKGYKVMTFNRATDRIHDKEGGGGIIIAIKGN